MTILRNCDNWKKALFVGGISIGGLLLSKHFYHDFLCWKKRRHLNKLRENYQAELVKKMIEFGEYLKQNPMTDEEIESLTSQPPEVLLKKLRSKELDYARVLLAYQHKAYRINQQLNCVTEFVIPNFDEINLNGPLAGLPVSFKENFSMKNLVSCAGCTAAIDYPTPSKDCAPVAIIKQLGGIPFCRTNIPQTMMSFQSSNPVYGSTKNPLNPLRTAGGSTSGEGALIGAGGSPLGIGTDIGGSIRIPALFCGIVGLKTTSGRLTRKNMLSFGSQNLIVSSWGPMSTSVEICTELFRLVTNSSLHRELDPQIPPAPFKESDLENRDLRIGYFTFDGVFRASPALVKVVDEVRGVLVQRGHKLVPFELPWAPKDRFMMYLKFISMDGGENFRQLLHQDKLDPCIAGAVRISHFNRFQHFFATFICDYVFRNADLCTWLSVSRGFPSVFTMWREYGRLETFRKEFAENWKAAELDALLCPAFGTIAPFLDVKSSGSYTGACSYTSLFNLLGYPAGTVPVRKLVESDLDNLDEVYPSHLGMWHNSVKNMHKDSVGSALGVQIATLPWHDELCLHVMKEVENAVEDMKCTF